MVQRYVPAAFNPETLAVLTATFEEAWQRVLVSGATFDGKEEGARASLAKAIVYLATAGERDRQRLADGALLRFKV
jgi:hypothetical protein